MGTRSTTDRLGSRPTLIPTTTASCRTAPKLGTTTRRSRTPTASGLVNGNRTRPCSSPDGGLPRDDNRPPPTTDTDDGGVLDGAEDLDMRTAVFDGPGSEGPDRGQ